MSQVEATNGRSLSLTQEHFTPARVVEAARRTLGSIDLDPASCVEANKTVQAECIYTIADDGLAQEWSGRVFLNPPGGTFTPKTKKGELKIPITPEDAAHRLQWGTDSRCTAWWRKLVTEHEAGRVSKAIFLGFTLNLLQSAQHERWRSPLEFPICVPKDRLRFTGGSPTHANVIVYLGPDTETFQREFSPIGQVKL